MELQVIKKGNVTKNGNVVLTLKREETVEVKKFGKTVKEKIYGFYYYMLDSDSAEGIEVGATDTFGNDYHIEESRTADGKVFMQIRRKG